MTNADRIYHAHVKGQLKGNPQRYIDVAEKINSAIDESSLFDSEAVFSDDELVLVRDLIDAHLVYRNPCIVSDQENRCINYGMFYQKFLRVDETFDLEAQTAELLTLRNRVTELEELLGERFTTTLAS